jgi:hypothetical protein
MANPEIKVFTTLAHLRVTINGLLHFSTKLEELVGIQSWIVAPCSYRIVYYTKTTKITCEYDKRSNWEAIIKGLETIDII